MIRTYFKKNFEQYLIVQSNLRLYFWLDMPLKRNLPACPYTKKILSQQIWRLILRYQISMLYLNQKKKQKMHEKSIEKSKLYGQTKKMKEMQSLSQLMGSSQISIYFNEKQRIWKQHCVKLFHNRESIHEHDQMIQKFKQFTNEQSKSCNEVFLQFQLINVLFFKILIQFPKYLFFTLIQKNYQWQCNSVVRLEQLLLLNLIFYLNQLVLTYFLANYHKEQINQFVHNQMESFYEIQVNY
ncbi:unnamed protein product [Paramecium octaurelia]|uniref:Transmembrane protein n=1 Tax=Paramecium octaurelia TaxID=43137 RepID=A0A8S1TP65_PAROT|nr:unnamed protein product [Paramecium octaurelia]